MRKPYTYMVVDTETATLPFVNEITHDAEEKKKIAIAKPLIYDIGWTICNRRGDILGSKQYLVAETFSVPAVFNTAYYAEKRPIYLDKLAKKETTIKPWNDIMEIFIADMQTVDAVGAYNSMFDFKKALPFTELYISKLYSPDYYTWEARQKTFCADIILNPRQPKKDDNFEPEIFRFRGEQYPLFDLWGLATKVLLNNVSYKKNCLAHDLLSASGLYFKTSAETSYQYLSNKYDFVESHTALDDAMIETFILSKIARRHAISIGIAYFPFRDLGETVEFVTRNKTVNLEECEKVSNAIVAHLETKTKGSAYYVKMLNKLNYLNKRMGL